MPDIPGQQIINPIDRMVGDIGEDVAQIGFGIDAVHACPTDERVHGGGMLATAVSAQE